MSNPTNSIFPFSATPTKHQSVYQENLTNLTTPRAKRYARFENADLAPCDWQNSLLHPGSPGLCNENVSFDRSYSRNRKIREQKGSLAGVERSIKQDATEYIDGGGIMPANIDWNRVDSLAYKKTMLRPHCQIPHISAELSPFKRKLNDQGSSLDQGDITKARTDILNSVHTQRGNQKAESLAWNNQVEAGDAGEGYIHLSNGAKSNNLYGNTIRSPKQPIQGSYHFNILVYKRAISYFI